MAVNTSVYGTSEHWIDCYYQQSSLTNKNKKANFGDSQTTLSQGVTKGKLSYSEGIDKSLSFCGLGTECALSHISFIGVSGSNVAILNTQDRYQTNFAFFEKSNTTWYIPNANFDITAKGGFCWQSSTNNQNYVKNLEPMTRVNPQNMVLLIKVKAQTAVNGTTIDVTLKQYIDSYKTTHPNILRVYIVAYYGNATTGRYTIADKGSVNNQVPFQLGLLEEYECTPKNLKFYMYSWYNNVVMGRYSDTTYYGNDYFEIVACPDSAKEHIKYSRYNNDYVDTHIEYYAEFEQDVLKTVACFGLYFTPDSSIIQNGALTHNNMFIGLLDNNGIGHGEYLRGAETATAPQNNYTDMTQSGYDYTKEVDKTKYINNTQFYGTWSSNAFTKMYVLTDSQVSALANELYTAVSAAPAGEEIERYNQSVFLTQNPIDCIISLKKFPMNLPYSAAVPMKLGSYTTTVNAAPLLYSTGIYSFTFSNSSNNGLYPWFDKSFLDYEPYTKCELTIPFCGTVEIPTTYLHDYDTIDVKLVVDFITGACTAYIQARNITIDSVSGECAVSLPVNGIQSATLDSQIHSAAVARDKSALTNGLGLIGGLAAVGIGIATGGIGTVVIGGIAALTSGANMITQDKNIEYELQHMQVPMKQVSGASGAINQSYDMRCKMRITRPKISGSYDAEVYANTVGFACLINTTVSSLSGLTVGDINLDGLDASDVEKQLIKNAFASGVIL